MRTDNLILFVYNFLLHAAFLAALPLLVAAAPFVARFRKGFFNYFGLLFPSQLGFVRSARKLGRNFYVIHGVSVGEIKLARNVMAEILKGDPGAVFALTTTAPDSFAEAGKMAFENRVLPLFFPVDIPLFWSVFFRALAPKEIYILEVDFWPNFLIAAAVRKVPVFLLNGRISDKTLNFYKRIPAFSRSLLATFSNFFMQTVADAERIVEMGAERDRVFAPGNMKFDLAAAGAEREKTEELSRALDAAFGPGRDFVFALGSTHPDEEALFLGALEKALGKAAEGRPARKVVVMIAPRRIERAAEIRTLAPGGRGALFSEARGAAAGESGENHKGGTFVMTIDAMGYLMSAYSIADAAFVGGTLSRNDVGGHNIIEPASFGIPVIFGPNVRNFRDAAAELAKSGAVFEAAGEAELAGAVSYVMEAAGGERLSHGCRQLLEIVERNSKVTEKIFQFMRTA